MQGAILDNNSYQKNSPLRNMWTDHLQGPHDQRFKINFNEQWQENRYKKTPIFVKYEAERKSQIFK